MREVEFGEVEASELRVKPNLPVLGPKLGGALARGARTAARGEFEELEGGRFKVGGHVLEPDEVLVERVGVAGLVGRLRETASRLRSTRRSTTTCCSKAACST